MKSGMIMKLAVIVGSAVASSYFNKGVRAGTKAGIKAASEIAGRPTET